MSATEFRKIAREAHKYAEKADSAEDRRAWQQIADDWSRQVEQAERSQEPDENAHPTKQT